MTPQSELDLRERISDEAAIVALSRANSIVLQSMETGWFVIDTNTAEPEVNWPGELIAGPCSYEEAKLEWNKAQANEIRNALIVALRNGADELLDEVERLREVLAAAAARFREYEELHRFRANLAGLPTAGASAAKAERNREMAEMCEAALNPKQERDDEHL